MLRVGTFTWQLERGLISTICSKARRFTASRTGMVLILSSSAIVRMLRVSPYLMAPVMIWFSR